MTFEGASDEQDVEKQVNTLDAVIAENPTVLCLSAGDEDSCQAQLEAARENDIAVVAFDSNVSDSDMIAVFRGTDNVYVGKMAGEKLSDAIGKSGKVAIFSAQEKTESSKKRVEGFKEALAECPDITVVQELYTCLLYTSRVKCHRTLQKSRLCFSRTSRCKRRGRQVTGSI